MRGSRILALIAALLTLAGAQATAQDDYLHRRLHATILVADPEAAGERLAAWAEGAGGYFTLMATDAVVLRIPNERVGDLRTTVEAVAEEVVEVLPESVDLREAYLGVQSAIRSREEILARNLEYIDRTDVAGTLAIEQEITTLLREIEASKGRLRRLQNDREFAYARVDLSYKEQTLPQDIPSSFDWINTVDFYRFVREVTP